MLRLAQVWELSKGPRLYIEPASCTSIPVGFFHCTYEAEPYWLPVLCLGTPNLLHNFLWVELSCLPSILTGLT